MDRGPKGTQTRPYFTFGLVLFFVLLNLWIWWIFQGKQLYWEHRCNQNWMLSCDKPGCAEQMHEEERMQDQCRMHGIKPHFRN